LKTTGIALTVAVTDVEHPFDNVYIIEGFPAETPVTIPDVDPTIAWPVALLLHKPPEVASLRLVVCVTQTTGVPVIAAGVVFTVTAWVDTHPPGNIYVITGVPAAMPVTTPAPSTLPRVALLLLHEPPALASLRAVVEPTHTLNVPVIEAG